MIWPFRRKESRATASYTDVQLQAMIRDSEGLDSPRGQAAAVAAAEACALLYARGFASASVEGDERGLLTPSLLAGLARQMVLLGEAVFLIETRGGLSLVPCSGWDVSGSYAERTWTYELELAAPSGAYTVRRPAASVVHVRWATSPVRPWEGIGPMQAAGLSAELMSSLETRLGQEAASVVAQLIPSPVSDERTDTLRKTIRDAKGGLALVPSMQGGWAGDPAASPQRDWGFQRLGAHPPESLVALRGDVGRAVAVSCGVPGDLVASGVNSQGQREAFRRFFHVSLGPLGKIVAEELSAKLDADIQFTFDSLGAADIAGRARAYRGLVEAGMDPQQAAAIAGFREGDGNGR